MSFNAVLWVDGQSYSLTACILTVHRKANIKGQPASKSGWHLDLVIDSVDDTTITEWMVDPYLMKDGEVEIMKINEDGKFKLISFKDSYCVRLKENFYSYTSFMKCIIRITGAELHIGEGSIPVL